MSENALRGLPAVHRFLSDPRIAAFDAVLGRERVKTAVQAVLEDVRISPGLENASASLPALSTAVLERLERERCESLLPLVNATGVLLHTNLGRAPLAPEALDAVTRLGAGYTNLEYDVLEGRRGSRYERTNALLTGLTGAAGALVVNNCAAAVLLVLDTFAKDREVIVARGELVEIGGGFRLPDVMRRSGAVLVEAGSTNKTYIEDYERALSPRTALLLRTHPSNYAMTGFVAHVDARALSALRRRAGIPLVEDLGSGALVDLAEYGLPHERTVREALAEGVDLVTFSGDKVLGGPQAGIIAGSAALIARLRSNPLLRALRVDKLTLAALGATLQLYASPERRNEIPFFAMLRTSLDDLRRRAQAYCAAVPQAAAVPSSAYAGGGTLAQCEVPSIAIEITPPGGARTLVERLRKRELPIVARIEEGRVLLDLRTILPHQDPFVIDALRQVLE